MLEGIRMIVLLVSLFLCAWIDWKTERVSVPLLLLGGMTAVLLHLFAQEESVFYLMTGMSVGIVLLLYSLVTHESICDDRFISGILSFFFFFLKKSNTAAPIPAKTDASKSSTRFSQNPRNKPVITNKHPSPYPVRSKLLKLPRTNDSF